MEEDDYLREMAYIAAEREHFENELLQEMYQKPAKVELLTQIPDDKDRIKRGEVSTANQEGTRA